MALKKHFNVQLFHGTEKLTLIQYISKANLSDEIIRVTFWQYCNSCWLQYAYENGARSTIRSSRPEVFCKKSDFKNFAKFTRVFVNTLVGNWYFD